MIIYNQEVIEKVKKMREQNKLENLVLDLEKIVNKDEEVIAKLKELKEEIIKLKENLPNDDHKKYISEIIVENEEQFSQNSLILAPVGSGKSTLIKDVLINEHDKGKCLILVSTRFLKESVIVHDKKLGIKTVKNKDKESLKNGPFIMTYHEFGLRIKDNNNFADRFTKIFCDEVHSLPEYKDYSSSVPSSVIKYSLEHAMKYVFNKHEGKQIFYFTATDENFNRLKKQRPELVSSVVTYDYRNHPEIKKYMELSKSYITHIEQIRPFLRERKESFEYFRNKGIAFGKTISNLKAIEKILEEEGYKPLVLWSDSNEEFKLSKEQIRSRNYLIKYNKIPEEYNFLVMNSALREGWDLKDPAVRMAIMNTASETDRIQARGRIRKDIDLIIYKTTENFDVLNDEETMKKYIGTPLSKKEKDELCVDLNIRDKFNRLLKWTTVKKKLLENGYEVSDKKALIDGTRLNVSTITIKTSRD